MNWQISENRLNRDFKLKSFSEIISRLNVLAIKADELNHHPDLEILNYNQIRFKLFTHDANAITEKDYKLAAVIDDLFSKY